MKSFLKLASIIAMAGSYCANLAASPKIEHWTTDNGLKVYFVQAPDIPMLDVRLVYKAGSAQDGARHGLAKLTASLMDEGAGDLDANAFNERLADTGANFNVGDRKSVV